MRLGYLLPTREGVMRGEHAARVFVDAAKRAHELGYDSVWVGDSVTARPRHDPLTLLAGVAGAVPGIELGTAVLLSMLRNPVLLAQQLATIDQLSEGRLVVGVGIGADTPSVRAEFVAAGVPFEGRVGRLLEGVRLCRALWRGKPVDWEGRWELTAATLAPVPYDKPDRPDGPPFWLAAGVTAGIERAANHFDGWFPIGPDVATFAENNAHHRSTAERAGRAATTAIYLTVAIADDEASGNEQLDEYLETYYNRPASALRRIQACHAGPLGSVIEYVRSYVVAGADHVVLRFVGDHASSLERIAERREDLEA